MATKKTVFISYSSKDGQFVQNLATCLKELNITYFKAPETIPVGSNYAREIPRAIKECGVFLLVLSKNSQDSIWVEKEIDSAINCRKKIVPVKIDSVPMNDLFTFYLNNVQTIPFYEDQKRGLKALSDRLCALLDLNRLEEKEPAMVRKNPLQHVSPYKRKSDVFTKNPKPVACQYCGGDLVEAAVGVYECVVCGKETYDYLRTVRNYLEQNGARSAVTIARETGVPRDSVEYFLREEFLEIPKYAKERLSCAKCGAPIRTGTLCEKCKQPLESSKKKKGNWYSSTKRRS